MAGVRGFVLVPESAASLASLADIHWGAHYGEQELPAGGCQEGCQAYIDPKETEVFRAIQEENL